MLFFSHGNGTFRERPTFARAAAIYTTVDWHSHQTIDGFDQFA
jgi:hypothetical protein